MKLSPQQLKEITSTVSTIAIEVGSILAQQFNKVIPSKEKTSPHDLVTKFDRKSEAFIYKRLLTQFPGYGFLGEENGYQNYKEGVPYWIVDPIDGTLNFANNIPAFAISIALVHHTKSYIGVCYNPLTKELFTAYEGGGAFLNQKTIKVSEVSTLPEAILSIPPNQIYNHQPSSVVRRQGSSVLDICYVAKGALEGYYDSCLNPWDFAAASLIAQEAGAEIYSLKTKTLDTNKKSDILVANKNIADEFAKWILMDEGSHTL